MDDDKQRKLNELDRLGREQDEQSQERDQEHAGKVQLGLLRARLIRFGLIDPEHPERATGNWHLDEVTGEVKAWFVIDGFAYSEHTGAIYVEHKVQPGDVYEWTVLDADGEPTEWMREPPPWSSAN